MNSKAFFVSLAFILQRWIVEANFWKNAKMFSRYLGSKIIWKQEQKVVCSLYLLFGGSDEGWEMEKEMVDQSSYLVEGTYFKKYTYWEVLKG